MYRLEISIVLNEKIPYVTEEGIVLGPKELSRYQTCSTSMKTRV